MRLGHFLRRRAVQQRLELPQRAFREGQTRCFEQQKGFDRTVLPQFFERTDTEPVQGGDGFGGERRRGKHGLFAEKPFCRLNQARA